ncbi:hypothetical protein WMY93_032188 [Mugilogobius chulae]|uniref:SPRY-associated domain-containing protein n=1 Tax=Mugilogobius chulae TaxID=88201 RepID=A0AAW0MGA0_9GOBI
MSTQDPCHFLQQYPSVCRPLPLISHVSYCSTLYRETVATSVFHLCTHLKNSINDFIPPEPEPSTRVGFLSCACDISMDPSSAHTALSLSEDHRQVTLRSPAPDPAYRPQAFNHYRQVLSREALTGRCYWEVEWSGHVGVRVALCYKDMERHGHSTLRLRSKPQILGFGHSEWPLFLLVKQKVCGAVRTTCLSTRSLLGPQRRSSVLLQHLPCHGPPPQAAHQLQPASARGRLVLLGLPRRLGLLSSAQELSRIPHYMCNKWLKSAY